jgi:acyl carrier protein
MHDHAQVRAQRATPAATGALEREIASLITQALNLDVAATDIDPDAPLNQHGLGLDSIDFLEIALVISKRYGIELKAEDEPDRQIFGSLRGLAAFIATHRIK